MSARDDHMERVMARVSEPMCWRALFDEIDRLRRENSSMRDVIEELWEWDDGRMPGRISELMDTLAVAVDWLEERDQ